MNPLRSEPIEPDLRKTPLGGATPSRNGPTFVFNDGDHLKPSRRFPDNARDATPTETPFQSTTSSHTVVSSETASTDSDRRKRTRHPPPLPLSLPPDQYGQYTIELLPGAYRIRGGNGNVVAPPQDLHEDITRSVNLLRADTISDLSRKALKDISNLREQIAAKRILFENLRRDYSYQKGHLLALQHEFMNTSSAFMNSITGINAGPISYPPPFGLWSQLQQVFNRVAQLEHGWHDLESQLIILERRLLEKEAQLYDGEKDPERWDSGLETRPRGYDDFDVRSARTASTDPLAEAYYDRIGDIHLLRERLYNFEAEHRRQLGSREAYRKRGENLELSDAAFFEVYFQQRGEIIREYSAADRDVQHLKEACHTRGLKVEEPNLPPFDEAHALDQSRRGDRSVAQVNPSSINGTHDIDNKARIAIWLSSVSEEGPTIGTTTSGRQLGETTLTDRCNDDGPWLLPDCSPLEDVVDTVNSDDLEDKTDKAETGRTFFQPDRPTRRYSEPLLSVVLALHGTEGFAISSRSVREAKVSKSVC